MIIDILREQAEKVIALEKRMEEAFPYGNVEEQRILCIMAGLQDAYSSGLMKSQTNVDR